uniref:Uncharacterized protein n=1 Tax=Nelumbo nucifera TaxID=4432 RepID=A0A822YLN6_NELNU|nr:TPA_asm: hypothetical protein HUJ06_031726 [Nelumbo nucifera]
MFGFCQFVLDLFCFHTKNFLTLLTLSIVLKYSLNFSYPIISSFFIDLYLGLWFYRVKFKLGPTT